MVITAPPGYSSYDWSTGDSTQAITVAASGTYACTVQFIDTAYSLVQNGDFSLGDMGFTSDYISGGSGTWGILSLGGHYAVATNPHDTHTNFISMGDHTTGTGPMLVVNGSWELNQSIWCQSITVSPNTVYAFSAWLTSVTPSNPAILDFTVNGTSLGTPLLAGATGDWLQFYALWNSGSATTASICITNQNTAASGNDFALDDITFSPTCSYSDSIAVAVLPQAPVVDAGPDGALCPGDTAEVTATLVPNSWLLPVSYLWNTGADSAQILVTEPGVYTITATGLCLNSQSTVVFLPDTCEPPPPIPPPPTEISMPNVFTPNGDGINDTFGPIVGGPPEGFSLEIRNRWGQQVFSAQNANDRWDGRADGGPLPAGTYYWVVRYGDRHPDGSITQEKRTGNVTLLRRH